MASPRRFARFAVPSVVSMWVFSLYTIVDGIFVARGVGPDAMGAVNLALPVVNIMFAVGIIFGAGASTIISITIGQGRKDKANGYFNQNLLVSAVAGIVITILILLFIDPLVNVLGATQNTIEYTKEYIKTIAFFAVFFIVSYNMEVLVKVDGTPNVSMIGVFSCALMNIVLDYLFVMVFDWGVKGAALATGIAQVTSTIIFAIYFAFRAKQIHFGRPIRELSVYKRIIPVGLSDGITEVSNGLIIFLFNRAILGISGETGLISYTVVSYVNTLAFMTMSGLGQGMQPLTSLHFGMGDKKGYHTFLRYAYITAGCLSVAFFAICQWGAGGIVSLFFGPESGEIFNSTKVALRLFSISFLLTGANVITAAFFSSIERPRYSLSISLGRGLVLLAGCLAFMAPLFGEKGVWLTPTVSEFLCLGLSVTLLLKYKRGLKTQ